MAGHIAGHHPQIWCAKSITESQGAEERSRQVLRVQPPIQGEREATQKITRGLTFSADWGKTGEAFDTDRDAPNLVEASGRGRHRGVKLNGQENTMKRGEYL
jgi:hypothetical protein